METFAKKILLITPIFTLLICFKISSQTQSWVQIGVDIEPISGFNRFGTVDISNDGSTIVVGGPRHSSPGNFLNGRIQLFQNSSDTWSQVGNDIKGVNSEQWGSSIELNSDGSILVAGGLSTGVYQNISGSWTLIGSLIEEEFTNLGPSGFGRYSLNANGNIVAIGKSLNDGNGFNAGHVRIYENISGTWTQIGQDIDGEAAEDGFGTTVSLSNDGSIIAVGAAGNDGNGEDAGHVRIYENVSGTWTQIGQDIDGEAAGDGFGSFVSLNGNGNIVAISASGNDGNGENAGHVRVYENVSGIWTQIGQDIDGEAAGDGFGGSIGLSNDGSTVVIGASGNDGNGISAGHVRVYKNLSDVWTQVGQDIDGEHIVEYFGSAVAINADGTTIAVGMYNNGETGEVRIFKSKLLQTITFEALSNKTFGDSPFDLFATSSSLLPVNYSSSDPSIASINSNTLTIHQAGTVTITASQDGSDIYHSALDVQQALTIDKDDQTINFEPLANQTFGDAPFELDAATSSALSVNYQSSNLAVATIDGATLTIVGAGSTNITASQNGNENYNPASDVQQLLTVYKADQTIIFGSLDNQYFGDAPFNLDAITNSGLAISYQSSNQSVATTDGNTVTIVGAGSTNITASQNGNENYSPASDIQQLLTVYKADQVITIEAIDQKTTNNIPFDVIASTTSNLPLSYEIQSGPALISGNTITLNGTGTVNVQVSQPGNENYTAASEITSFEVIEGGTPEITISYASNIAKGESIDLGGVITGSITNNFFLISNTGDADLILSGTPVVSISNSDLGFCISQMPITNTLASGETTVFGISFSPTSLGTTSGQVSIPTNDPEASPFTFQLEAFGFESSSCSIPQGNMETFTRSSLPKTDLFTGETIGINTYKVPGGWNPLISLVTAFFGGDINTSQTADARSGTALELISDANGFGDVFTIFSCATRPVALKGYYKFTGADVDSAIIAISTGGAVEENRTAENSDTLYIENNVEEYAEFNLNFSYSATSVDSILIYLTTTNNGSNSSFKVDDLELAFAGDELIANIPDKNFKTALLENILINTNMDAEIQMTEASSFTGTIDVSNRGIEDLTGLEAFNLLTGLNCSYNPIETLDLSSNLMITSLDVGKNNITELDLSKNSLLTEVVINSNEKLTSLNIQNANNEKLSLFRALDNPNLTCIQVDNVPFSELNWTNVDEATSFSTDCSKVLGLNSFTKLSIYPNPAKRYIKVKGGTIDWFSIYSLDGRLLLRGSDDHINIDILPKGIYSLNLIKGTQSKSIKILKN